MRWILMFRRANEEDGGRICQRTDCLEDELIGEKERIAAELERNTGEPWICVTIVPVKPEEGGTDDD